MRLQEITEILTQKVLGVPGMVVECTRAWPGVVDIGEHYTVKSKCDRTLLHLEGVRNKPSANRFKKVSR